MTKEETAKEFARKYKLYLYQNGIAYHQVGSAIGVCANTIGNWLRGDKQTQNNMDKLIEALRIILKDKNIKISF